MIEYEYDAEFEERVKGLKSKVINEVESIEGMSLVSLNVNYFLVAELRVIYKDRNLDISICDIQLGLIKDMALRMVGEK